MSMNTHNCISVPFARAVIRAGRITLHPKTKGLIEEGPVAGQLRLMHASLVDLIRVPSDDAPGDELIVKELPPARFDDGYAATLVGWASTVGYQRVWLPGEIVELDGEVAGGLSSVDCPTCGMHIEDGSFDFWLIVRNRGCFPNVCIACGGSLPQWNVEPQTLTAGAPGDDLVTEPGARNPALEVDSSHLSEGSFDQLEFGLPQLHEPSNGGSE